VSSNFAIDIPSNVLTSARQGDIRAFEQIYRWFERPVFTLAHRLCGQREEAQDVLQECMIKLYHKLGEFRGDCPFWAWFRQIVVNECLMRLRKRQNHLQAQLPENAHELEGDIVLPPQAADTRQLNHALQSLPDTTRSVLWLYHVEGYTHEEIAELMNKTVSFSKSQCARGGKKLRELLSDSCEVIHHG
jgi:RNA polymerase sigma factor (sigma-70 family)